MAFIEKSEKTFARWSQIILFFSLFTTLVFDAFGYFGYDVYPTDLNQITWGTDMLSDAIATLQKGLGVNVIIAVPQIVGAVATIFVQLMINSILLINWLINKALYIIFVLVALPESTATTLSSILAWILEAPLIVGMISELGKIVYSFLPFGSGGG
ncbi:MAG: hypothetical protein DRO01_00020 [Thermoproteota archaeon]|nr:MAG: hypothetical protein DRO01_00020 [Candidatus Korarchaeota archaeon]